MKSFLIIFLAVILLALIMVINFSCKPSKARLIIDGIKYIDMRYR